MIVVLGGSGLVGSAICSELRSRRIEHLSISRRHIDYTNAQTLDRAVRQLRPNFLINCAGVTGSPNVDACESAKSECLAANAVLPGTIRTVSQWRGFAWGHVSSGCIYSGNTVSGEGFCETDRPNFSFGMPPCSWYSVSALRTPL